MIFLTLAGIFCGMLSFDAHNREQIEKKAVQDKQRYEEVYKKTGRYPSILDGLKRSEVKAKSVKSKSKNMTVRKRPTVEDAR